MRSVHRALRSLTGCRAGVVAIEMALIAPILIVVFMGGFDFGMAFCETHRYAGAARAGVQQAMVSVQNSVPITVGGVQAAAQADYVPCIGDEEIASPSVLCWCPDPDGAECECDSGGPMYISVTVDGTRDLFFNYPGVPNPLDLSETAWMRLR